MSHDIARDVYNALVVPAADTDGTLPPAFCSYRQTSRPEYAKKGPFAENNTEGDLTGLLNAAASLCVIEPRHHRVAVSLVHRHDSIVLHIAHSAGEAVASHIQDMVHDIWSLLVEFSRVIGEPNARSSQARARGHEAQRRILERLARHGIKKLRHRVLKRWDMFQDVCIRLQKENIKHGGTYRDFFAVSLSLTELKQAIMSSEPADWGRHVAPHLGRLYLATQKLSAKGSGDLHLLLGQLALSADECHRLVHQLKKYISKCTTIVSNANMIMKLATYRTHSPILNIPYFGVRFVSCRRERHPPAGSLLFWKSLFRGSSITREPLVPYHLHPECALLEFHHNAANADNDSSTFPDTPSHQLGFAKDPCYACRTFFSAYLALRAHKQPRRESPHYYVYMRLGSAGGHCAVQNNLWLPPRLDGVGKDVEAKFASQLLEEYRQHTIDTHDMPNFVVT